LIVEQDLQFLVPERGRAQTTQGEVIRIAGKIEMKFADASDAQDLLLEYSDEKIVANSDNCNGNDFQYTSLERMQKAICGAFIHTGHYLCN
jgi:hypothetical protein